MKTAATSPIQLAILEHLRTSHQGLRYSQMRPDDLANDLYNYHLQQLVRGGLVRKTASLYQLSEAGMRHLINLNPTDEVGRHQHIKIAALCCVVRGVSQGLELLYQQRTRQPFAGDQQMVAGGIRRGEPAEAAATRRLAEEAGLRAEFRLIGLLRKRHFDQSGAIYSDISFHVCLGQNPTGQLTATNQFGSQAWISLEQAIDIEQTRPEGSPQFAAMLQALAMQYPQSPDMFYIDEAYRRDIR